VFEVPPHISKRTNNSQVINLNSNKTSYASILKNVPKVKIYHPDNINNKCYNYNSFNSKNNESKNTDNKYNDHVSINIDIKENDFHTFLYEKKGFQIAFLNVHHLFPKFDEIKLLLKDNRAPHIFALCETFLDEKTSNHDLEINNFVFERRDHSHKKGGGILVYLNHAIMYEQLSNLESDDIESMYLKVKSMHSK